VDTQSGRETTIPIVRGASGSGNSDFLWTGNNEITYIDENVVYKITTDGQKKEVNRIPTNTQAIFYYLNKSANKIMFDTAPEFDGNMINVFVYDFATQQKIQISEGENAYALGWAGNNVVYQQGKVLWSSSVDGKNKKKLTDLGEWHILASAFSQDGSKVFFTADNRGSGKPNEGKVFVYDSMTNTLNELGRLDHNTFASNLSISRDAGFGGYTLAGIVNAPSLVVNFTTNKVSKLCASSCYDPIWQN
jgi:Tol biopolymer transport system component